MIAYSYLGQGRVLCVDNNPSNLNHFRAVLGDIYSVLVAGSGDVNDAVLVELTLALALLARSGARL
jgi:response regulator RpfG family c-di-GMP phosphodiesterase